MDLFGLAVLTNVISMQNFNVLSLHDVMYKVFT